MLCANLNERSLGENGYMYMYGWVPSLFTWNNHNTDNWLYPPPKKIKSLKFVGKKNSMEARNDLGLFLNGESYQLWSQHKIDAHSNWENEKSWTKKEMTRVWEEFKHQQRIFICVLHMPYPGTGHIWESLSNLKLQVSKNSLVLLIWIPHIYFKYSKQKN